MIKSLIKKLALLVIFIIIALVFFSCKNTVNKSKGVFVTRWDNIYENSNIKFYYEDENSLYMKNLVTKYDLLSIVKDAKGDFEIAMKIKDWVHSLAEYSKGSDGGKEDAVAILEAIKSSKKASDKDFAIVYSEVLTSLGIPARVGEFRSKDSQFNSKENSFYVSEFWSETYKKWIMVDVANNSYFETDKTPLSAEEILSKGLNKGTAVGLKNTRKYYNSIKNYFYSYTIAIDNTTSAIKKSNSYITYLPNGSIPEIKTFKRYVEPTIFVNKPDVFKISPKAEYIDDKSDVLPTLIFMKKDPKEDKEGTLSFVVGAFKNSIMVKEFYLSVNGSEYIKISKYKDIEIRSGQNTFKLSEDGKKALREIVIEYKK